MSLSGTGVFSPDLLAQEINSITENYPDALVVGSIGRAGIYGHLLDDPEREYRARDQHPTQAYEGGTADIDLLNAPASISDRTLPFNPDLATLGGRQVSFKRVSGKWLLLSENRGFEAELDDRVMEPTLARTVYNARCYTLPAQTHHALIGLTGTFRPKDEIARDVLTQVIQESRSPLLPNELYEPFRELFALNYESSFATARRAYRTIVPLSVRKVLAPAMQVVKDRNLK